MTAATPAPLSLRVVVADKMAPGGLELLARTPGIEVVNCAGKPREELERALERAHALIVRSETRVTADLMNRAPQLKVIARAGIGVDTIDVHAATRRGIAVMNAPGANTVSAAEHAMGLLLSLVRHLPWAAESMRRGEWDRKKYEGTELRGKTLGIVGLGRIGGHVAGIARAFGMTVIGHDPYLSPERTAELQVKTMPLEQMLAAADVVTLHLALTDQTRHLINAERLAAMKPTAIIVNTARGELIDEAALAAAITAKKIAGAALDVFTEEPLAADSPLRKLDRVILTPHLAASTAEAQDRVSHEISTTVRDALLDGDLSTAVNVSGVGAEALRRATPLLDLARRLGRLALALADLPVSAVELAYGGKDESVARPALLAALEGLLTGIGEIGVSLVNAPLIAEEHGIRLTRRTGAAEPGFETSLEVVVEAAGGRKRVVGALVAGTQQGRVIKIDDYGVDLTPDGWVLVIRNRDVPGVIGRVGTLLGEAGVNVASWNQARRGSGGEALAAIAVDQSIANGLRTRLEQLPDLLEVRVVNFG
jgi:D-3-phosphoglycerate dehydrogenase / 2-oxoglutarate reductase